MTALVTGASSGIGEAFARKLAARGYDLILVARREDRLRTLAETLPGHTEVLSADLASEAGLAGVETAVQRCASLDLLVNNAGLGTLGRFWEAGIAGQVRMHEVHVMATMRLTHAALAGMVPRGRGAVINVSSVAAFVQSQGGVSYCATKAWINSFTQGLALELRRLPSPVRVQALCPGFTATEFHLAMGTDTKGIPPFLCMQPDYVVEASLKGLDRGKVIVVPNWKYKIAVAMMKHLPRALIHVPKRRGSRQI
jgi:uncharacterized protein